MNVRKPEAKVAALLPIGVFLVLYLGLGLILEYCLKIEMAFYNIPIVGAFMVAVLVASLQNRSVSFDKKLELMAGGVGDKNIMTMILIFLAAGVFVGTAGRSSAEAVAYFLLSVTPPRMAMLVMFIVACFVSTAMGTSVGTITLLAPIGVAVAEASGISMPFCIGTVMGGAMFGDNLSFISDTTIAACSTQGCAMKDKFRSNVGIAVPAALATIVIIVLFSMNAGAQRIDIPAFNMLLLIPYILVLIGGVAGINVFIVLLVGIFSASILTLITGTTSFMGLLGSIGSGISGMYETILVTIMVSALCGMIRAYGGFEALLGMIRRVCRSNKGGQLGMAALVGVMDIATANNTVAIVMAGPIAKEMSDEYGISPQRAASLLDTSSCVFQGILPYGAQMLVAISTAAAYGHMISAFEIIPFLFYPFCLAVASVVYIFLGKKR